jgi:DNA polymerase-4
MDERTAAWGGHRAVIHLDLDAFYASVEQLRDPALRGQPVIVGGARDSEGRLHTGRGVVAAASYEVRRFGVRSAMPLRTALRLCPQARVVPADFDAYRDASQRVFAIARHYTPLVEPLSLDEAYLDVGGSVRRFGEPPVIAASIRDRILAECRLHASFGVATGKTVAKIASEVRKPRGFVVVPPGEEAAFLAPLELRALPGLGPTAERQLVGLGLRTLGDLARLPLDVVTRRLGEAAGRSVWERAQGIDHAPVTVPGDPKSISREETFWRDVADAPVLAARLRELATDVGRRLRAGGWQARTVTLKLRYSDFATITRQVSVSSPTASDVALGAAAQHLLDAAWNGSPVRLLGVGASGLVASGQLELLAGGGTELDLSADRSPSSQRPGGDRDTVVDGILDELRRRFGEAAVRRGTAAPALSDLDFRGDDLRRLARDSAEGGEAR